MLGGRFCGRTGRGGAVERTAGVVVGGGVAEGAGFLVGDWCGERMGDLMGETGTVEGGRGQGEVRIECVGDAEGTVIPGGSLARSVDQRASAVTA